MLLLQQAASRSMPRIAAIEPCPFGTAASINSPRLRTVYTASSKLIAPEATKAVYSPKLCPAV